MVINSKSKIITKVNIRKAKQQKQAADKMIEKNRPLLIRAYSAESSGGYSYGKRNNVYGTAHLESSRKEKKVVQFCMRYLSMAIWGIPTMQDTQGLQAIPERPESVIEDQNNNILNSDHLQKANKRKLQKSYNPVTNMASQPQDHECTYCLKIFQSKATLDIHLMTKRHDWQLKKAIENMDSINNEVTTEDDFAKHYLTSGRNETQQEHSPTLCKEGRYSNGSLVSSEEGYYSTDSDETKHMNTYSTTTANGPTCQRRGGVIANGAVDMASYKQRPSVIRLKRMKMEELKEIYKQYAASRGSGDLYKNLLDTYVDFNFYPDAENRQFSDSEVVNVSAKSNRKYSVSEKEALMRRDLVLTEMADTEKNYVDDLAFIINEYFPLMDKDEVSEDLNGDFEKIFGNIQEIYKFHSRIFSEKIEDCLEDPQLLNETFCQYEDELATLYSQYCKCKPYADEALHNHQDEIDMLRRKYLPKVKFLLKDYLVTPVQRLMKYQLLLITAKKYSEKSVAHKIVIKDAIEVMDRVPKLANDAMHVELIKGYEGFLQSEDLLFQEVIEVDPAPKDNKCKPREMRVFIFDSMVMFCDIVPRKGQLAVYKYVGSGQTSLMGITETIQNEPYSFAIFFRKFNSTNIYQCKADNKQTKDEWIQVLKDVIALQMIIMNRASQHTSLDRIDGHKKREGVYRRTSRGKYVNDLVVGETLRQALQGHPRIGEMSERLKNNIERYILNELIMASEGDPSHFKQRSQSIVPISSLVDEWDLKPTCRPRFYSQIDYTRPPYIKDARPKAALVQSITHVSFNQLDA
ncbi:uncharacterized protein [Clytia hemisphaerica]|uniref:DH domain-containing protein n=1 Tax=Clytia hemisphaerica TaxID=252671 RepID=A0A7M6DPZ0_9CNID